MQMRTILLFQSTYEPMEDWGEGRRPGRGLVNVLSQGLAREGFVSGALETTDTEEWFWVVGKEGETFFVTLGRHFRPDVDAAVGWFLATESRGDSFIGGEEMTRVRRLLHGAIERILVAEGQGGDLRWVGVEEFNAPWGG